MCDLYKVCWICLVLLIYVHFAFVSHTISGDEENSTKLMKWHKAETTFDGTLCLNSDT